jgi:hypothetical protein
MRAQNKKVPRKRKAKWGSCKWCEKREISPPFCSGKMKCLAKHMVICETEYIMEQNIEQRPKIDGIVAVLQRQQLQIAVLSSRVSVLEARRAREERDDLAHWTTMSPKKAWQLRKENTVRALRACLRCFQPSIYHKTSMDYLEMMLIPGKEPALHDILSIALWPVIETREHQPCLKGIQTTDVYCIFKNIWGKKSTVVDLTFWKEALEEVGVPLERFYSSLHIYTISNELQRMVLRFQNTKKRAGGGNAWQGLAGLVRAWRNVYPLTEEVIAVAKSLGPGQELKWGIEGPADLCPSGSTATRAENTTF